MAEFDTSHAVTGGETLGDRCDSEECEECALGTCRAQNVFELSHVSILGLRGFAKKFHSESRCGSVLYLRLNYRFGFWLKFFLLLLYNPLASGVDFDSITKASDILQSGEQQPVGALP